MNGALAIEAITRGVHDVFAAVWAGGLLIMAFVVIPTMKSMRAESPQGVADAGRGAAPGPARFMVLVQKRLRVVVMVVIAIIRAGKLRRLGDAPGDPKASGIPLLFANASLALVVLLLSGVAGAIGA